MTRAGTTGTAAAATEARQGTDGASVVRVVVNGQPRTLPAGQTLADLLRAHDLDPRLVVVERNREILRDRDAFASLALEDGDELELVHFVGGG
jgi:thiazole synthase